ncbi:unnamed protein product [Rotaria socialis]|uniref:G-protein coupled receptors family 1 profile domain-containing protein n=1 Tax=Rotaria socialis TaxID=392032 RepID=A0A818TCF9_9BILA|nr:unnamed protein product [Rotaria socialis]CAF4517371.1 unnamed protein product [Rotaria socialis]
MFISACRTFTHRNSSYSLLNLSIYSANIVRSSHISDGEWIINSISLIIFVLAVLGNTAALFVMFGSRGPVRLTNNKYLVNLACADLLRACFMPFTIIARVKRNFVFGPLICKILPIVQGLSVAVDVFTLVCISVERYIAICRPLLILKLQSLRFANFFNGLILFLIWTIGLLTTLPNISMYNLCSLPQPGRFKCEKVKPQYFDERVYMISLDVFYFLAPMLIMPSLYTLIICKIYKNNTATKMRFLQSNCPSKIHSNSSNSSTTLRRSDRQRQRTSLECHQFSLNEQNINNDSSNFEPVQHILSKQSSAKSKSGLADDDYQIVSAWSKHINHNRKIPKSNLSCRRSSKENQRSHHLFNSNTSHLSSDKSHCSSTTQGVYHMDRHRRKALKLLIVIIVEFFICRTPLFIYHTFGTFDKKFYRSMPTIFVDLILLFSFASLLCNPFTYYFMSKRYRSVLYGYLSCCICNKDKLKFNNKNQEARNIVEALRLHQRQNTLEYKQKSNKPKLLPTNHSPYEPKLRSNTLE